ncbi:MAG: hypothetical protein GF308_08370 [Candidatus Heimdallarchaeota archaeon]|nr:hypothetical protein [Candidatus Heimdallarchaeota archaeon]
MTKKTSSKSDDESNTQQTKNDKEIEIPYKNRTYTFDSDITEDELKSKRGVPIKVKEKLAEILDFQIYRKKKPPKKVPETTLKTEKEKKEEEKEEKVVEEEKTAVEEIEQPELDYSLITDGRNFIEQNKLEAAMECFVIFSEEYPEDHFGWFYRGYVYYLKKDYSQAKKNLIKAYELNENYLPSIFYHGYLEYEREKYSKAREIFEKIMERFSSEDFKQHELNVPFYLAVCYQFTGKLEKADEYFLYAYNIDPRDPIVLFSKGTNELALEKYDEAITTFKKLLRIDLNYQSFWDLVAGFSHYYHQAEQTNKKKKKKEKK